MGIEGNCRNSLEYPKVPTSSHKFLFVPISKRRFLYQVRHNQFQKQHRHKPTQQRVGEKQVDQHRRAKGERSTEALGILSVPEDQDLLPDLHDGESEGDDPSGHGSETITEDV